MIGDVIKAEQRHYDTAQKVLVLLQPLLRRGGRLVLAVGGESGSGKSVTAVCLRDLLAESGLTAAILHLDDYFVLPPATNHQRRLEDIGRVGMQEVHMDILQEHVDAFRAGGEFLRKPLSNYHTNEITEEMLDISGTRVLIVEGTYSLALQSADCRIFLSRNYLETKTQRLLRGREADDEFIERVLAIEHAVIAPLATRADILIDKSYHVMLQNSAFPTAQP